MGDTKISDEQKNKIIQTILLACLGGATDYQILDLGGAPEKTLRGIVEELLAQKFLEKAKCPYGPFPFYATTDWFGKKKLSRLLIAGAWG
jgi:hypothetical protein